MDCRDHGGAGTQGATQEGGCHWQAGKTGGRRGLGGASGGQQNPQCRRRSGGAMVFAEQRWRARRGCAIGAVVLLPLANRNVLQVAQGSRTSVGELGTGNGACHFQSSVDRDPGVCDGMASDVGAWRGRASDQVVPRPLVGTTDEAGAPCDIPGVARWVVHLVHDARNARTLFTFRSEGVCACRKKSIPSLMTLATCVDTHAAGEGSSCLSSSRIKLAHRTLFAMTVPTRAHRLVNKIIPDTSAPSRGRRVTSCSKSSAIARLQRLLQRCVHAMALLGGRSPAAESRLYPVAAKAEISHLVP